MREDGLSIDVEQAVALIERTRPAVVMFGASEFLFPVDLVTLVPASAAAGAVTCYDGAHPLGLIAGGEFQDPFGDHVDVMVASTNKTFFGPHRGIVLTREDEQIHERIRDLLESPPFLQSSHHVGTAVALAAAMAEMEEFGRDYARQVVECARSLAMALDGNGVPVLGATSGYTASHQVLIDCGGSGSERAIQLQGELEGANVLADLSGRFGSQQLARLGMGPDVMSTVARLIADVYHRARPLDAVRAEVSELAAGFPYVGFSFDGDAAFPYFELAGTLSR
jgi:glycine hydroxymethyltransferase